MSALTPRVAGMFQSYDYDAMDKGQLKSEIVEILIAVAVALVGCIPFAYLMMYESILLFEKLYPHDGQSGLGALYVGIFALPVGFAGLFFATMAIQKNVKARRRLDQSRRGSEPQFTITGRPVK
ncbi:MAG TPA: hypothetical protein VFS41_04815 [Edaphobacter sp.]|nr:hypothetical protein [Edaphobacter sp.]